MKLLRSFFRNANGTHVWIDVPSIPVPMEGRVEAVDSEHVLLSCDFGLFVVALGDVSSAHVVRQAEIVAPEDT